MSLNNFLLVVVGVFAVFRVAELFSIDDGPYGIFKRIREYAGRKAISSKFWFEVAEMVNCPYCVGIWIAFFLSILISIMGKMNLIHFLIIWMAIAGGQSFLWSLIKNGEREES